jgi:hypothetical protein
MASKFSKYYLLNCFLLTIPILLWNIFLSAKLPLAYQPEFFWKDIPFVLALGENGSRIVLFLLTCLMPLQISTPEQKKGMLLYLTGTILYFMSWLLLIYFPESAWSQSVFGFMAPAYTPLLWLIGIGLVGKSFYFKFEHARLMYFLIVADFMVLHNIHTFLIYSRISV